MISVNGVNYTGRNVSIINNRVIIDGSSVGSNPPVVINITGDIHHLSVDVGTATIHGKCTGSIKTMSGDVECGDVSGDVETMSGDVTCGSVDGSVNSMSGDIRRQK